MLPDGMGLALAWTPRATGTKSNDKASSGSAGEGKGAGWDIAANYTAIDGLNIFGGYSTTDQASTNYTDDRIQHVLGATYAIGSVTVGYQQSVDNLNEVEGTAGYDNTAYGVSFAINDDLSISYGKHDSSKRVGSGATKVENSAESLQLSYTMGGATVALAETQVDNASYVSTTTHDRDGTTVSLSLAF
jgi:outer membrane protein OmpU